MLSAAAQFSLVSQHNFALRQSERDRERERDRQRGGDRESNKLSPKSETHFKAISRNCKKADNNKRSRGSSGKDRVSKEREEEI